MELILFFFLSVGGTVGVIVGRYIWRRNRARTLATSTVIAQYELLADLTPAEFAMLYTGKITREAILGNLVLLIQKGIASTDQTAKGIDLTFHPDRAHASDEQNTLRTLRALEGIHTTRVSTAKVVDPVQSSTLTSLEQKGWLVPQANSSPMQRLNIKLIVTVLLITIAGSLVSVLLQLQDDTRLQSLGALIQAVTTLAWIATVLIAIFARDVMKGFITASPIVKRLSDSYRQRYRDLHGLYIYMTVSGLDIMTPDYHDLSTIRSLDPLYPYAVAVGIDTQIQRYL